MVFVEDLKLGISLYCRQSSLLSMTISKSVGKRNSTMGNHFCGLHIRTIGKMGKDIKPRRTFEQDISADL